MPTIVTPNPVPDPIAKSGIAVELQDFVTVPASADSAPTARLNFLYHAYDAGDALAFDVALAEAGQIDLEIRYAQRGNAKQLDLVVDGENLGPITFPSTGAWTSWAAVTESLQLSPGVHRVVLDAPTSAGAPNIDHLLFTADADILVG